MLSNHSWACAALSAAVAIIGCSVERDHNERVGPVATPLSTTRPSYNTGTGFFTAGGKVFDANGAEFVMRGTNYEVWADTNDQNDAIAGMNRAHLNAARLNFPAGTLPGTEGFNAATVQRFVNAGIVPIIAGFSASGEWPDPPDGEEAHAKVTTCSENPAALNAVVDNWVGPQRAWLISQERYVILDIANEWGGVDTAWRDQYIDAVTRIRNAGIKALLMIDAGGCGQIAQSIESWGSDIAAADPQHNVVFSVHPYGFWLPPGDPRAGEWNDVFPRERTPYDMSSELDRLRATGLPIVAGEYCGWDGPDCKYAVTDALATFESKGIGYMSWEWMNIHEPNDSVTRDNRYNTSADLYPWGQITIEHPTLGSQALAQPATVFGGGSNCSAASCDDGDPCTVDGCSGDTCEHSPISSCNPGGTGGGYAFESGTEGWLAGTPGLTLAPASLRHFDGSSSLAANITVSSSSTLSAQVDDPVAPAGATVTAHVFCPEGAPIGAATAWVAHAGEDNGAGCGPYEWTGSSSPVAAGAWTSLHVTVPACASGLSHLGVDFDVDGPWTGTCYIDAVNW